MAAEHIMVEAIVFFVKKIEVILFRFWPRSFILLTMFIRGAIIIFINHSVYLLQFSISSNITEQLLSIYNLNISWAIIRNLPIELESILLIFGIDLLIVFVVPSYEIIECHDIFRQDFSLKWPFTSYFLLPNIVYQS